MYQTAVSSRGVFGFSTFTIIFWAQSFVIFPSQSVLAFLSNIYSSGSDDAGRVLVIARTEIL